MEGDDPDTYQLWFRYSGQLRRVIVHDGMASAELGLMLVAVFQIGAKAKIAGGRLASGAFASLNTLVAWPKMKGVYDIVTEAEAAKQPWTNLVSPGTKPEPAIQNIDEDYTDSETEARHSFAQLLSLTHDSAERLLQLFLNEVGRDWVVDRTTFGLVLETFLGDAVSDNETDQSALSQLEGKLFDAFNTGEEESLSLQDVLSGLHILQGGADDSQVRDAFESFDLRGAGYLVPDDVIVFLKTIFTTMSKSLPSTSVADYDTLAQTTSEQCFQFADLDRDGRLTYEEFRRWYTDPGQARLVAVVSRYMPKLKTVAEGSEDGSDESESSDVSASDSDSDSEPHRRGHCSCHPGPVQSDSDEDIPTMPEMLDLVSMRDALRLDSWEPADVLHDLASVSDDAGMVSFDTVQQLVYHRLKEEGPQDRFDASSALNQVFRSFGQSQDGHVHYRMIAAVILALSVSDLRPIEYAAATFAALSDISEGYVSLPQLSTFLNSLYQAVFGKSMALVKRLVAASTVQCCGYSSPPRSSSPSRGTPQRISAVAFEAWFSDRWASCGLSTLDKPLGTSLDDVAVGLRLSGTDVPTLAGSLYGAASSSGLYRDAVFRVFQLQYWSSTEEMDLAPARVLLGRLVFLFDTQLAGLCSPIAFLSAACLLSRAQIHDAASAVFAALSRESGDDQAHVSHVVEALTAVVRLRLAVSSPSYVDGAYNVVGAIVNGVQSSSGMVSRAEFTALYRAAASVELNEDLLEQEAPAVDLVLARSFIGQEDASPLSALRGLFHSCDDLGRISRVAFTRMWRKELARCVTLQAALDAQRVVDVFFDCFALDEDGMATYQDVGAGLSCLSTRDADDVVQVVRTLYDDSNSQSLSYKAVLSFFMGFLKVLLAFRARANDYAVTRLARSVADACFAGNRLGKEGRVDLAAFRDWYVDSGVDELRFPRGTGATLKSPSSIAAQPPRPPPPSIHKPVVSPAKAGSPSSGSPSSLGSPSTRTIEDITRITGLRNVAVDQALALFEAAAEEDGSISRDAFHAVFEAHFLNEDVRPATAHRILDELFDSLDIDGVGCVDHVQLAAGLSTLCSASASDLAEIAFALYDKDCDMMVSFDEMKSYLTAVYRVLMTTDPSLARRTGATPEKLAHLAAKHCFQEADADHDGQLTLDEFKTWYQSEGGRPLKDSIVRNAIAPPDAVTISEMREMTGLGQVPVNVALDLFDSACDANGDLSRAAFMSVMLKHFVPHRTTQPKRVNLLLDRLFDVFDKAQAGKVSCVELSSGLVPLCAGSVQDKAEVAFALYDRDNDGALTRSDMQTHLTGVFKALFAMKPDLAAEAPPEVLAELVTNSAWVSVGLSPDDAMTLQAFKQWAAAGGDAVSNAILQAANEPPASVTLEEAAQLTGLNRVPVNEALAVFDEAADEQGRLTWEAFFQVFKQRFLGHQSGPEYERSRLVLQQLFQVFDADNDGVIDASELMAGLTRLCAEAVDRVAEAFALFDQDCDGFVSRTEMTRFLVSMYKVTLRLSGSSGDVLPTATALAERVTDECFAAADPDGTGQVDLGAFQKWYSEFHRTGAGFQVVEAVVDLPVTVAIEEVQRLTDLRTRHVEDVMGKFAAHADDGGRLSRRAFYDVFSRYFVKTQSNLEYERTAVLLGRLFDVFDCDHNGAVDAFEACAGIALLCAGSREEKCRAVFAAFDRNSDGKLSFDEMVHYLRSVFAVVASVEASRGIVRSMTPQDFAVQAAERCFAAADQNHDGFLTLQEFSRWFTANAGGSLQGLVAAGADTMSTSIQEVRALTGLGGRSVTEVANVLRSAGGDTGLSRSMFITAMQQSFMKHCTTAQLERATGFLNRLFDAFDVNQDHLVDWLELQAGLSILCGGSTRSKSRALFDMFDEDGDGCITVAEMTDYLEAVFRAAFALQPERSDTGVTPESLAVETTKRCFWEADVNRDGTLSFEEFAKWFESDGQPVSPSHLSVLVSPKNFKRVLVVFPQLMVLSPAQVTSILCDCSDSHGQLSQDGYWRAVALLGARPTDPLCQYCVDAIWSAFVGDHSSIDYAELAAGLSVAAQSSAQEKAVFAFKCCDDNGDGLIDVFDVQQFLWSLFRVVAACTEDQATVADLNVHKLAFVVAESCFARCNVDATGHLDQRQFETWFLDAHGVTGPPVAVPISPTPRSPSQQELDSDDEESEAGGLMSLDELRAAVHLASYTVQQVLEVLEDYQGPGGTLTRRQFDSAFRQIIWHGSRATSPHTQQILDTLFAAFDADENAIIDARELVCGLSILCGGSVKEKVQAVVSLFDHDGSNTIGLEDMQQYLCALYTVIHQTNLRDEHFGFSPTELAASTAEACFKEADLNSDGRLTVDEMCQWFSNLKL